MSLSATRSAVINIREGDDLRTVTKSFCMTHNLNKPMQDILIAQLNQHMQNYLNLQNQMLTHQQLAMNQKLSSNAHTQPYEERAPFLNQSQAHQDYLSPTLNINKPYDFPNENLMNIQNHSESPADFSEERDDLIEQDQDTA